MKKYLFFLLLLAISYGNTCFCGSSTRKTGKRNSGGMELICGRNHISWTESSGVYQGGRGMAFEGRKGNSVNSNDAKLKKEELKQNERIELAKMTPEQREYYLKAKAEEKRKNQIRNNESATISKYAGWILLLVLVDVVILGNSDY